MRYDEELTRAATSSSIVDERRARRKVVKVRDEGEDKSGRFWRLARGKESAAPFHRRELHLIAVRAGDESGSETRIGYRSRRPAPCYSDTALLGGL